MGLLAGSTVMLLTIVWGSCLIVGKCDLDVNSVALDGKDTKTFSFTGKPLDGLCNCFLSTANASQTKEYIWFVYVN
jgi:hypothetical protein